MKNTKHYLTFAASYMVLYFVEHALGFNGFSAGAFAASVSYAVADSIYPFQAQ